MKLAQVIVIALCVLASLHCVSGEETFSTSDASNSAASQQQEAVKPDASESSAEAAPKKPPLPRVAVVSGVTSKGHKGQLLQLHIFEELARSVKHLLHPQFNVSII